MLTSRKKSHLPLRLPPLGIAVHQGDFNPLLPTKFPGHRRPSSTIAVDYPEADISHAPPRSHSDPIQGYSVLVLPGLDADSHQPADVSAYPQRSVTETRIILNVAPGGGVLSGNLEGLVDRLIHPRESSADDLSFRSTLLATCADFTTPEEMLATIVRRFHESEHDDVSSKDATKLQSNVFDVLTYWLSNNHLQIHPQLLSQIQQFCLSTMSPSTSPITKENAGNLLRSTGERATVDSKPSVVLPPGTKIPKTADILPRDLAIALTLLEDDRYSSILPADYICHLRKLEGTNNVDLAGVENNKIVLWVKKSILTPARVEGRAAVLKFFVNTAQECRKLRNFASLSAITNAVQSTPIERLTLTVGALSPHLRDLLQDLKNLLDPSNNHQTYRAALKEVLDPQYKEFCIPWLAVHLRDLHSLLQNHPAVIESDGFSLINFHRYVKFMDHTRGLLRFKPPDLERYRSNGQLAYLQHQLLGVHFDPDTDVALMQRSLELEVDETRIHRTRALELKRLGFRSS
ncbi:ras guanine nucleotide exchange factor domain-containing protein [Mycena sp. CBHHK59/15]|nr:ras guanine nucleotide exchange factor domain-containing protein [Mycena sp. CBHHK59/15]